jgi:hypothetical protein
VPNLQLLEGPVNQEKSDQNFADWLQHSFRNRDAREEFKRRHYIPENALTFDRFEEFFENRKSLMLQRLKEILM